MPRLRVLLFTVACVFGAVLGTAGASYAGQASFGVTGCRRSVPHLQRLLPHLGAELDDLEKAVL